MKFGVLGTGMVGRSIALRLVSLGHEVRMGSRQAGNEAAVAWAREAGPSASEGTFADAAQFGEMNFNCTAGTASLAAVSQAGAEQFAGKVVIDLANRLEMGPDGPQLVLGEVSLGEELQSALPGAHVVKTLNTVNHQLMVDPSLLPGSHTMFVAGNHAAAKVQVVELLESFGWPARDIVDLGDITAARATELYMPLWLRLWQATQAPHFNIKLIHAEPDPGS